MSAKGRKARTHLRKGWRLTYCGLPVTRVRTLADYTTSKTEWCANCLRCEDVEASQLRAAKVKGNAR